MKRMIGLLAASVLLIAIGVPSAVAQGAGRKPYILVIWDDDIGWSNVGAYDHGVMGYATPNIDSLAEEGVLFTDRYARRSVAWQSWLSHLGCDCKNINRC